MGGPHSHARRFAFAGAISVLLHASLLGVAASTGAIGPTASSSSFSGARAPLMADLRLDEPPLPSVAAPEPETPKPPQPEPEPDPALVENTRLGIEDGDNIPTQNWLGFKEPTPHEARQSTVEQPQLDPDAGPAANIAGGRAGAPGEPVPPQPRPDTKPAPAATPEPAAPPAAPESQTPPIPETHDAEPAPSREEFIPDGDKEERDGPDQAPDWSLILTDAGDFAAPRIRLESLIPPIAVAPATDPVPAQSEPTPPQHTSPPQTPTSPAHPPANPGDNGANGAEGPSPTPTSESTLRPDSVPGERSEKESPATSLEPPVKVRPGRTVAAKGLEIITKRPEFSDVAKVTTSPRFPVVEVIFGRDGTVVEANILVSSGYPVDVDHEVLNAVYRWRAKGEALRSIPPNNPKAGKRLEFEILLR